MITHPVFVALFLTSPVWLLILGFITKKRVLYRGHFQGRLSAGFFYLSLITFVMDIIIAVSGPASWQVLFNSPVTLAWIPILLTFIMGVTSGEKIMNWATNNKEDVFGVHSYWSLLSTIVLALVFCFFILWLSSFVWELLKYFYYLFTNISSLG